MNSNNNGDDSTDSSSSNTVSLQLVPVNAPPSPQESVGSIRQSPPPLRSQPVAAEELGKRKRGRTEEGSSSKVKFDGPEVATPCSVCGKRFGSWKALFGHMRSHPERPWRGVHPPPTFNREGSPESVAAPTIATQATQAGGDVASYLLQLATQVQNNLQKQQHSSSRVNEPGEDRPAVTTAASPTRLRRGLDIDLNEPHPEEQNPSTPSYESEGYSLDLNLPPPSPRD